MNRCLKMCVRSSPRKQRKTANAPVVFFLLSCYQTSCARPKPTPIDANRRGRPRTRPRGHTRHGAGDAWRRSDLRAVVALPVDGGGGRDRVDGAHLHLLEEQLGRSVLGAKVGRLREDGERKARGRRGRGRCAWGRGEARRARARRGRGRSHPLELLPGGGPVPFDKGVDAFVEGLGELLVRRLRSVDLDEARVDLPPPRGRAR